MAITRVNQINPTEHLWPFNACTCTTTVNVGDLIVALVEFNGNSGDTNVINLSVSDNVNSGNYSRIGQAPLPASGATDIITTFYKVANAAGTPSLVTSTLSSTANFGKISCLTFTGFTGTPTLDTILGVSQIIVAPSSSVDVFAGITTLQPNSVAICQLFVQGSFLQPVPAGWTFGQAQFYLYKICPSAGTSLEVSGPYNGTSTNPGAIYMLSNIYDAPNVPPLGVTYLSASPGIGGPI